MDEIRECVYQKADEYHSEYLMQVNESEKNQMIVIWKNYIRFRNAKVNKTDHIHEI